MLIREHFQSYLSLIRFDKPIGTLLLLWPTLWALWLASLGHPDPQILSIFIGGVFLMRAAGCVVNDVIDQKFDAHVGRTKCRPLVQGQINTNEAIFIAIILGLIAFSLVLFCNGLTIYLALIGALLTVIYPYLKRITHLPQLGLGLAFSWGVPMAFAAQTGQVELKAWLVFVTAVLWPLIYDTQYAMVDKKYDLKIGVKSTAILFAQHIRAIIGLLQMIFLSLLLVIAYVFELNGFFVLAVFGAALLFIYQQVLMKSSVEKKWFAAFQNNNWLGFILFVGLILNFNL